MRRAIIFVFVILMATSVQAYTSNWYADEHFSLGKRYYQNGQYNIALKEFQEAIRSYETFVLTERSPKRGKMYYYMALSYFHLLENYAIDNPYYKIITAKASAVLDKAIQIQYENPVVRDYYTFNPIMLFRLNEPSFIPEVREYQEMRNLKKMFERRRKANMFTFSRNLNMRSNILEMSMSSFKSTIPPKTEAVKEEPEKTKPTTPEKEKQTLLAEESKKKAKEVSETTDEILPTIH